MPSVLGAGALLHDLPQAAVLLLDIVDSLFAENRHDTEFLSLLAWALGKLGACEKLDALLLYVQGQLGSLETRKSSTA